MNERKLYRMFKKYLKFFIVLALIAGACAMACFGVNKDGYGSAKDIKLGLDLNGGLSITFQAVKDNPTAEEMSDTKYKLQKRVEKYSTEANVYKEGDNRINVEIPLKSTDMESAKAILDDLGTPGTLEFTDSEGTVVITGMDIVTASAKKITGATGAPEYIVALTLSDEGREKFKKGTAHAATLSDNRITVTYDGNVVSNPSCKQEIDSKDVSIEGMADYEEADKLATFIRIGAIPLELTTIRSNIVAPELGTNAIETSLYAGAIGIALIILFMICFYRIPGFAASLALVGYVSLVIFLVSSLEVTLTLPGIAGIILSIGMAVDANVIIFARIREEIGNGNTVDTAIANGFNKAFSAIFDGNITTLIAAVVLYVLGSGTVKGFAVTLAIGIILSMFTALVVTKTLIKSMYDLGAKSPALYGSQKVEKPKAFLKKKPLYVVISCVAIIAGIVSMGINQSKGKGIFNFGIEFIGGSATTVTFNSGLSQKEIDEDVLPIIQDIIGDKNIQTQRVESGNEVTFKTSELTPEQAEKISAALHEKYNIDESKVVSENISSTVSKEMQRDAIVALSVAIVAILLYIWFRFRNIRFATSAVIALLHDVLVVVAFYALSRISVGNTFIACILTIVGYSINATIVIFDRIREDVKLQTRRETLEDVVNKSITSTLSRSINTTITTAVMLIMLLILGVSSIKEFSIPLLVGVLCGCYSSICVAGSLWHTFMMKFPPKAD